jgi:hypothetical protein
MLLGGKTLWRAPSRQDGAAAPRLLVAIRPSRLPGYIKKKKTFTAPGDSSPAILPRGMDLGVLRSNGGAPG